MRGQAVALDFPAAMRGLALKARQQVTGIDRQHDAGYRSAAVARKQDAWFGQILHRRQASRWNPPYHLLALFGLEEVTVEIGLDITGRQRVRPMR